MIAHGEAEDVDMAVEHVKKEAHTESAKKWGQKKEAAQAEKAQQRPRGNRHGESSSL